MSEEAWIGRTLDGRYTIKRFIGRGGMGAVYEADQPALDRKVAIKVFTARELPDTERERFRREAKLASRIVHENVVQIFDIGTTGEGIDYIVMEYVEGRDLSRVMRDEGALSPKRAVAIARGMLQGLQAIHDQDIVHRDVKPSNVIVGKRGDRDIIKIVDFGIARAAGDRSLTKTGSVVGTAYYMAPEQFRGARIDHRADLYAVGVTLYAMLTGKVPFEGNTAEVGAKHVFDDPPALERVRKGLPSPLVVAVSRALAKAPEDRFDDALAFAAVLDDVPDRDTREMAALATRSSGAQPVQADANATVSARPGRRKARWPWVVAAVTIVAGGVVGVVLAQRERTPHVASHPQDAAVVAQVIDAAASLEPVTPDPGEPVAVVESIDAGVHAVAGTKPTAKPSGTGLKCQCIATNGPDVRPLCAQKGESLCRCDDPRGRSVCPFQLIKCGDELKEGPQLRKLGRSWDALCDATRTRCSDLSWDRFTKPGKVGEPCLGYKVYEWPERGEPDVLVQGKLNCDHCPDANTQIFRGQPGDKCTGYYWRNGQELTGTLKHCE